MVGRVDRDFLLPVSPDKTGHDAKRVSHPFKTNVMKPWCLFIALLAEGEGVGIAQCM